MRERRDAKKKQQQEAVENKLRRVQLRESAHALKSKIQAMCKYLRDLEMFEEDENFWIKLLIFLHDGCHLPILKLSL